MEIKHIINTTDLYSDRRTKVVAEQALHLGQLRAEASQWEQPDGAYESVSLTAPHVSVTAHLNVPGVEHGWTTASVHGVTGVDVGDTQIVVRLSDGSKFVLDLFHA